MICIAPRSGTESGRIGGVDKMCSDLDLMDLMSDSNRMYACMDKHVSIISKHYTSKNVYSGT